MKRCILTIICVITPFFLITSVDAATGGTSLVLKPSLTLQMKKNTLHLKKYTKEMKVIGNQKRLETIRKNNKNPSSNPKSTDISWNSTIQKVSSSIKISQKPQSSTSFSKNTITNVDMSRVRSTWIGWYNATRSSLNLESYMYDARLDSTAHDWNRIFSAGKWLNHHTRTPGDGYYNFIKIDEWFIERGIDPPVVNRSKHTENVGYGYYNCNQSDCTDELIASIRSTYDFFMSEKGKSYDAHYRSIVNPVFSKIGLDIIVVPSEKRYYLTVHYITE